MDFGMSVFLLLLSMEDIRERQVSLWVLVLGLIAGLVYAGLRMPFLEWALGVLPGVFLVITSIFLPQGVGLGDGLLALVYGLVYGWRKTCLWIMYGFALAAVMGVCLCLVGRSAGKRVPFIPVLLMVHVGMMLC